MKTPEADRTGKKKTRLKKLIDWVNADAEASSATEESVPDQGELAVAQHTPGDAGDAPSGGDRPDEDAVPMSADLDAETEDYEDDNEFEYPDEVTHEEIEDFDEDYIAGDETRSAVPHEALHLTVKQKRQMERFRLFYLILAAIVAINLAVLLLFTVSAGPEFGIEDGPAVNEVYVRYVEHGLADTGAPNLVAAVLFSYRSFDTLGEAFVLFAAVIAVMILMQKPKDDDVDKDKGKEGP